MSNAFASTLLFAQDALTRSEFDVPENIAFAIIAAVMLFSAFKMVTTGNVVHAALYLVIVLAASAAIFILLGSDFVGATQILVYIGAIIVLFLFGIMLTKAQLGDDSSVAQEKRSMGALVAILLMVVMTFALVDTFGRTEVVFGDPEPVCIAGIDASSQDCLERVGGSADLDGARSVRINVEDMPDPVAEALGVTGTTGETIVTQSEFEALDPEVARRVPGAELFGNNKQVADAIFSQYIVPFEAVSVLLLAALIGAIVVARKE